MEEERIDLLAQVAIWYYEEGLNQAAIAERIDKSRSMVSRLLDQAREAGLVEVRVRYPLRTDGELEQRLCQEFDLAEAHVLANPPEDYQFLLRRLGELGARCLQVSLHPGIIIGLSWGTGVHAMVSAMPTTLVPDSTVVQLIGAVGYGDPMVDGTELGRWLAQKLGASFRFLSAPLLVKDEVVAQALRRERINQETLTIAARAEVAIIGIGTPEPEYSSLLRAGYLSRGELNVLLAAGVVGDIVAHQFDEEGHLLDISANRRAINLDAESIRRIPRVIAVSGSVSKARAIAAALRGGFCNCLVTDAHAAQAVLELQRERSTQGIGHRAVEG
ncbi:MAG: sugar-binding transcriptional regulator [Chloroflexi bacterium]|nr:sugar-binding transcriptional regulator [Chloroflexota bacterium]